MTTGKWHFGLVWLMVAVATGFTLIPVLAQDEGENKDSEENSPVEVPRVIAIDGEGNMIDMSQGMNGDLPSLGDLGTYLEDSLGISLDDILDIDPGEITEGTIEGPEDLGEKMKKAMEKAREKRDDKLRILLEASVEEWKVLKELISKVNEARRVRNMGLTPGFGPMGSSAEMSPFGLPAVKPPKSRDIISRLNKLMKDENPDSGEIKKLMDVLRDARKEDDKKLRDAIEALRAVVSIKQEAILVGKGILD